MKVVVTGGAGFIGCNLCRELVKQGHDTFVIDNLHSGDRHNLDEVGISGFMQAPAAAVSLMDKEPPDIIFHEGIFSSSPMYLADPSLYIQALCDFHLIMRYCVEKKVKLVFASSSSLYNGLDIPHNELDHPIVMDWYTEARYAMERLMELYVKRHGVKAIGLRYFSVYGPHEEHKGPYANLVSQFYWAMRANIPPSIYGDGMQRRDFIHVDDVVRANMLAMKAVDTLDEHDQHIFNVGTGTNYSLNDVVSLINSILGKQIHPNYEENKIKNYVSETKADTDLAESYLGFNASIQLYEGIMKLKADWDNPNRVRAFGHKPRRG